MNQPQIWLRMDWLVIVVSVPLRYYLVFTTPLKNNYQLGYGLNGVKYDDNRPLPMIGATTLLCYYTAGSFY